MKIYAVEGPGYLTYVREKAEGYWVGTGAKILALPEQVEAKEWRAVRLGVDPETGEKLQSKRLVDRTYQKPWGEQTYKARQMFDIVVSAPKTVSVMSFDPRISEAHKRAVEKTWQLMEHKCGAMVIAQFDHHSSRSLDPQEHSHLVAGNVAFDGDRWRTLHVNNLYRSQVEITEHYREHLLGQLEREGYRIDYPELADVPKEIAERFSQRSQQRDEGKQAYAARFENVTPADLTPREVRNIVRNNRPEKVVLPRDQVRQMQLARLSQEERRELIRIREDSLQRRERMRLSDNVQYEPGMHHERWDYGEDPGMKMKVR